MRCRIGRLHRAGARWLWSKSTARRTRSRKSSRTCATIAVCIRRRRRRTRNRGSTSSPRKPGPGARAARGGTSVVRARRDRAERRASRIPDHCRRRAAPRRRAHATRQRPDATLESSRRSERYSRPSIGSTRVKPALKRRQLVVCGESSKRTVSPFSFVSQYTVLVVPDLSFT